MRSRRRSRTIARMTRSLGRGPHWTALALGLAALPPILVGREVARFAVDMPLEDQWGFAGDVIAFARGEYGLSRLWLPAGQHRVVLSKLVMLPLARLTGWDVRAEMWFDFAAMLAALGFLAALARRTLRPSFPVSWSSTLPVMSAALFSLVAWQSWTWGWMMAAYLNVLAVTIVAWALGRFGASDAGVAVMVLAASAAALNFISGMVLVGLVPVALALLPRGHGESHRIRRVAVAALLLGAMAALYIATYPRFWLQRATPTMRFSPLELAIFVLRYLGSPMTGRDPAAALLWGTGGLLLVGACALLAWARGPELRAALLPWLLLVVYIVGAGAVTAIGRMASEPGLAVASRYTTISALFWASVPPLALLAAESVGLRRAPLALRAATAVAAAIALLLFANAYATTWEQSIGGLMGRQSAATEARACLLASLDAPDACIRRISRQPGLVRRMSVELAELRYGPFRERGTGGP